MAGASGNEPRFFAESALRGGAEVELSVAEAHHAMHVMRLAAGDAVELFDGQGRSAKGKITQAKKGAVTVALAGEVRQEDRPAPAVHLAFAVPKGKRLDWLLEKATELGAASLTPVIFERSVAGGEELGENKRDRWRIHCVSAAKQSGLNFLPELREPVTLAAWLSQASASGHLNVAGDLSASAQPFADAIARSAGRAVSILVGPEGGLTDSELAAIAAAGVVGVRLGSTVLRIETAAVALLAATLAVAWQPN